MKKWKLMQVFLVILFASLFVGCNKEKMPKDIQMFIWDNIKNGQYDKAVDIWSENSANDPETGADEQANKQFAKAFAGKMQASIEQKGGVDNVKLISQEISEDGTTAVVKVLVTFKDGTTENDDSNYKKVDGEWKINNSN